MSGSAPVPTSATLRAWRKRLSAIRSAATGSSALGLPNGARQLADIEYNLKSERPAMRAFLDAVPSGATVWQIGAGHGAEAVAYAHRVAEWVGFEADETRVHAARYNIARADAPATIRHRRIDAAAVAELTPAADAVLVDIEGGESVVVPPLLNRTAVHTVLVEVHGTEAAIRTAADEAGWAVTVVHRRGGQEYWLLEAP